MIRTSSISNEEIQQGDGIRGSEIRRGIFDLIRSEHPRFDDDCYLTLTELNRYRRLYLTSLMVQENGELAKIDENVMNAIRNNSFLSDSIQEDAATEPHLGQRIADRVASFGGSWTFIITFFLFILLWMAVNVFVMSARPFDPYPFILLNLILSCIAAIQAPIIMMSQNRQEQKDRQRSEHDYRINLKAEIEIKLLSEKMDHLLVHQNKKLLEIQEVQVDYLEDLLKQLKQDRPS